MFCKVCGKDIHEKAVICPHCGCETGNPMLSVQPPVQYVPVEQPVQQPKKKENTPALVGFILSILGVVGFLPLAGSIAGLILGIIGYKKSKTLDGEGKAFGIASIIMSAFAIASLVLLVLFYVLYFFIFFWAMTMSTPVYY